VIANTCAAGSCTAADVGNQVRRSIVQDLNPKTLAKSVPRGFQLQDSYEKENLNHKYKQIQDLTRMSL